MKKKCSMWKWTAAVTVLLASSLSGVFGESGLTDGFLGDVLNTSGDPLNADKTKGTGNCFYGYRRTGDGPGAEAFNKCRDGAKDNELLLMIIYGKDDCSTCKAFANAVDTGARALTISRAVNGYFRGNDTASLQAKDFFSAGTSDKNSEGLKSANKVSTICHIVGFYGVAEDGTKYKHVQVLPTDFETFNLLHADQKSAWNRYRADHKIRSSARFLVRDTVLSQLQATLATKSVSVPVVRATNYDVEESGYFFAAYPDGTVFTNALSWTAGEKRKEIRVDVEGKWANGKSIKLTLADIAGNLVDTGAIHFVDGGTSFSFPDMEFDENASWGQWTLYSEDSWNAATQKVYAANMYSQSDTNDNAAVEHVVMDVPISPSNRYEVVYTDDIAFFAKEVVDSPHEFAGFATNLVTTVYTNDLSVFKKAKDDEETEEQATVFAGELMVVTNYVAQMPPQQGGAQSSKATKTVNVTNYVYGVESADDDKPVEWTWASRTVEEVEVECETNVVVYVETEDAELVGTATTNFTDLVCSASGTKSYYLNRSVSTVEVPREVEVSFASNCVYAVVPQSDLAFATNLYSCEWATYRNEVAVTNTVTTLPCGVGHAEPSSLTVENKNDPSSVKWEFALQDTCTYYTVASNWEEVASRPYECFGTNRTFYVELPGCVTNEDVSALAPVPNCGEMAATNFYYVVLTNAEHEVASTEVTWTNFEAIVAVDCTNFYYTIATNEYQYGQAGRDGGRSNEGFQSFVLKVTGGTVWNADTVAFASVLESDIFREWCESNQVVTLIHECSDPDTGASLFSHTVAANGHSGSAYLSRNGLVEGCEQPPASNVFEVALYRPDGSLVGILAPQMKGGACDLNENMTRLDELRALADDMTEPANGDAATTGLKAYYGRSLETDPYVELYTLDVSDKKDVFGLEDVPAGTYVSIGALAFPETRYDGLEKPRVKVWRHTSAANTTPREIPAVGVDPEGAPVWRFDADDLNAGVYADVTAWTEGYADTETFGGSKFLYALTVLEAPEFQGVVSFVNASNEMYDVDSETRIELKVNRSGYTGEATATVALESCELPSGCYSWTHKDNATNLVWKAGDPAVKSVFVTVRNVTWEDSVSNMVFTISATTGAGLDEERKTCKIGIQQEDDENALTGRIYISGPEVASGETIWKKSGVPVDVVITRERVLNETSGKSEARGAATASLSVTGGATMSTNVLEWLNGNRTGERAILLKMPDSVSGAGQQIVEFSVIGVDCDGKQIQDMTASRLKFCVVPSAAPEFLNGIDAKAYQYVDFNEVAYLIDYDERSMEMVEANLIAGALPAGLSASADGAMGGLRVSGRPTGTDSATATYQLTLRQKSDGSLVKTMPVTVKIEGKALGGGGSSEAVIPGFASKRVWQYLPMTNGEQKLVGLLNLSASTKGSLSARYTMPGKTVSFSAESLGNVVEDESAGGYRAYSEMDRAGYRLDVSFATSGEVVASVTSGDDEVGFVSEAGSVPWSGVTGGASAWRGRYVAAFPQAGASSFGTAALALNISSPAMAKAGKVTYSGVLPNGKPMNGTTALLPAAENSDSVRLPILWSSAAESFSAMLVVSKTQTGATVACDPCVKPSWSGDEESELSAVGSSFVAEDWATAWARDFNGAKALRFKFGGNVGAATVAPDGMAIKVGEAGSVAVDGFELESIVLNRVSGIVTGSVRILLDGQLAQVSFRGVALPGDKERFMVGSAWYHDEQEGVAVRRAVPVEIVPAAVQ